MFMALWSTRGLVGLSLLAAAVGGVSWLTQRPISVQAIVSSIPTLPPCTSPVTWRSSVSNGGPSATVLNSGWRWWQGGVMLATTCGTGTLTVSGTGKQFEGAFPLILLTMGGQELVRWKFNGQRQFKISVPGRGQLALAFVNAAGRARVRYATVNGCGRSLLLLDALPVELPKCDRYSFEKVSEGRDWAKVQVDSPMGRQTLTLKLRPQAIESATRVKLLNPLYEQQGSRSLVFDQLEFHEQ